MSDRRGVAAFLRMPRQLWGNFRHAVNVSWLALRDGEIGWVPKSLGVLAALVGVAPLEWIPGIDPIFALSAELVLIPGLLAFAWWLVPRAIKDRLAKQAEGRPFPLGFLALVVSIFLVALGVDTYFDWNYPGEDAVSRMLDPYLEGIES